MTARFQRDISGGASGQCGIIDRGECVDFGVRPTVKSMKAATDDLPVADDHAADHRVGFDVTLALARKFQGHRHERFVIGF